MFSGKLGSAENPVIRVRFHPGYVWRSLGRWPDFHSEDTSPEMDRATARLNAMAEPEPISEMPSHNPYKQLPDDSRPRSCPPKRTV